ncbi:MAG TPA: hypothetical protein VNI20_08605 [Fimbriimonadaceae bacterium]|nr:hypothetical protein [Fimbriimonadaceae bacterium]
MDQSGLKKALTLVAVLLATLAPACMWDYDTLSMEAKGLPDVVDAIVGRFPKNPPLYYQMRLDRVTKAINAGSTDLDLYDDAAVACERLGRDDGIAWLDKKRKILDSTDPGRKKKDDWYRYFANIGTLRIHRWMRAGASAKTISEADQAISEIEEALKINPDAHFGREWVQLGFMRAIRAHVAGDDDERKRVLNEMASGRDRDKVLEGLVGLITLGSAWNSPDVLMAITDPHLTTWDQSISFIAEQRVNEMLVSGAHYALGDDVAKATDWIPIDMMVGQSKESLLAEYHALRANAKEYQDHRTEFMMERLKAGRHPDTDPKFWDGYKETPRVNLRSFEPFIPVKWHEPEIVIPIVAVAILALFIVGVFKLGKLIKRRRAS